MLNIVLVATLGKIYLQKINTVLLILVRHYPYKGAKHIAWVIVEVLICSTVTPPYFDYKFTGRMLGGTYTYSFDDMVVVVSLLKCLLLLRLYESFGKWSS